MTHSDRFEDLRDLIRDVKSVITNSEDRDKVYAIIDRLVPDKNDVNYGVHEYHYGYLDSEVYAIIEDCGFDGDQVDILAKLGRLTSKELCYIKWYIERLELEK